MQRLGRIQHESWVQTVEETVVETRHRLIRQSKEPTAWRNMHAFHILLAATPF